MSNTPVVPARRQSAFPEPKPSFGLMRMLGIINRWILLRGHFRVRGLDFPQGDRDRLRSVVNERTAAFIAPNHPEFGLDWMMDKELSTIVAPRVACWASHGIVASAPWFWTRNNLVANNGGDAAKHYSVEWATRGHGVLLHPEGSVRWTSSKVHPLFHGAAEMAIDAARRLLEAGSVRPTFIVPIAWKYRYTIDVSANIHREMELIERDLALENGRQFDISDRFYRLQCNLLATQMATFDVEGAPDPDFFSRQHAFRTHLVDDLMSTYAIERASSIDRTIERITRAIRQLRATTSSDAPQYAHLTRDLAKADEARRLGGFSRDVYSTARLSQEQIFESLKRLRAALLARGIRNTVHNYLPKPYGPRVAHVCVPEPIAIDPDRASAEATERADYVEWLTEETRRRLQRGLDRINSDIADAVDSLSHPNPFVAELSVTDAMSSRAQARLAGSTPGRETPSHVECRAGF